MVPVSPWPILTSFSFYILIIYLIYSFKFGSFIIFSWSLVGFLLILGSWYYALDSECQDGNFTYLSYFFFRFGFVLFICSEVLFFFGFFWCFFSNCWVLNFFYFSWPPYGFDSMLIDKFGFPLLKTVLLLSSGFSMTMVHYFILSGDCPSVLSRVPMDVSLKFRAPVYVEDTEFSYVGFGYCLTIMFGLFFLYFQLYEYMYSYFKAVSTVYGSIFYVLTGFHGFHVLIGLVMLLVSYFRYFHLCYSSSDHVGFECAVWYWHFVDVVWLFLYVFVYWYGS